ISGPLKGWRRLEERHGLAGTLRRLGVWGAISGPPISNVLADWHAGERVLRQRDVLVADTAVEIELQALPLPQEGDRLTAHRLMKPVFTEEDRGDGRHLVGCGLDRRDCHGCFASCLWPGGCRLTAGL